MEELESELKRIQDEMNEIYRNIDFNTTDFNGVGDVHTPSGPTKEQEDRLKELRERQQQLQGIQRQINDIDRELDEIYASIDYNTTDFEGVGDVYTPKGPTEEQQKRINELLAKKADLFKQVKGKDNPTRINENELKPEERKVLYSGELGDGAITNKGGDKSAEEIIAEQFERDTGIKFDPEKHEIIWYGADDGEDFPITRYQVVEKQQIDKSIKAEPEYDRKSIFQGMLGDGPLTNKGGDKAGEELMIAEFERATGIKFDPEKHEISYYGADDGEDVPYTKFEIIEKTLKEPEKEPQGSEPGKEPQGQEPEKEPQGSEPGKEPQGQEPEKEPQGQEPGKEPQGQEPGKEPQGQEPGKEPQGQEPGKGPQGQEPGKGSQGQEPGKGPELPPQEKISKIEFSFKDNKPYYTITMSDGKAIEQPGDLKMHTGILARTFTKNGRRAAANLREIFGNNIRGVDADLAELLYNYDEEYGTHELQRYAAEVNRPGSTGLEIGYNTIGRPSTTEARRIERIASAAQRRGFATCEKEGFFDRLFNGEPKIEEHTTSREEIIRSAAQMILDARSNEEIEPEVLVGDINNFRETDGFTDRDIEAIYKEAYARAKSPEDKAFIAGLTPESFKSSLVPPPEENNPEPRPQPNGQEMGIKRGQGREDFSDEEQK